MGGLATGLASYTRRSGTTWVGWPGLPSESLSFADKQTIIRELKKHRCHPVFLTKKQLADYYNGYSNSVLWPLFHEVPVATSVAKDQPRLWHAYRRVNKLFADTAQALSDGARSIIWVHDYQLMLVPELLRLQRPYAQVGFFLHIPFPPSRAFARLAEGSELLNGLLGSNLIGFHTTAYTNNFLDSVSAAHAGLAERGKVILPHRVVRVTDFPMGIDYGKYVRANRSAAVQAELVKLHAKYSGRKVILTVDRLDPTKGLIERVTAYGELLRQNPALSGKVVLVMLAVPSRTEIEAYQRLKDQLEELIRQINREFETPLWRPIDYLYDSLPFEKVTALYQRADVAFIAPLKDGMNLVAKEYLASKPRRDGVLVLSNTAGAAQELKDAIMVNPRRPASLVHGLERALTMPQKELAKRLNNMQKHLAEATVQKWAAGFMGSLARSQTRSLTSRLQGQTAEHFTHAKRRLLLLDYDGVLVSFRADPDKALLPAATKKILQQLCNQSNTTVVIVSGRRKVDLATWFHDMSVNLVAEHGAFWRPAGETHWQAAETATAVSWQAELLPILTHYTELTPGAHIERKTTALVWHYRGAAVYTAQKHLVALNRLLKPLAGPLGLEVRRGDMILEIKPVGINKGAAIERWLTERPRPDFVLAIGDDYTDEDMFMALSENALSIKVGRGRTAARFRVKNVEAVRRLLRTLADQP